jgi:endo-1,4-beta-xylanase
MLKSLAAEGITGIFLLLGIAMIAEGAEQVALKDAFEKDFLVGAAINASQILEEKTDETALITKHFNSISPENVLKWEKVHPEPDRYDFELTDKYVEFGEKNNMFIIGHTLVWHHQTPGWVFEDANGKPVDRETLLKRMKEHIFTVAGRYKGRIDGWDVVNEAVGSGGRFRKTKWLDIIGRDFVEKAFEYAHEADPNAELYYNDYDLWIKDHRAVAVKTVKDLKAKGIRIDAVGMQGHWSLDSPPIEEIEATINAFAQLGVKVMITEMDVSALPSASNVSGADIAQNIELRKELNPYPDGLPAEMQEKLAKRYAEFFSLFHKHADVISRVTFWGVHDGVSWRHNWPVRGRTDYPLLFDRNLKPKPAFYSVIKVVKNK